MKGYIYKITSPTGRIYIGQTTDLKGRIYKYQSNSFAAQQVIHNSIKKYGWDAHEFEIIEERNSELYITEILNALEVYHIGTLKCNCARYPNLNGMNLTDGGGGTRGAVQSQETKDKRSESQRKAFTEGRRTCHWKGRKKVNSKKTINAIIESNKRRTKAVICVTTNTIYSSIIEAAQKTGCAKNSISQVVLGNNKTTRGLAFKYYKPN